MNQKSIHILFSLVLLIVGVNAQDVNHRHYKIGEDLECKKIYTHFEDSKGYLWLGTDNGTIKYDGISFKHYDKENGLAAKSVLNIGELKNGTLWFASLNKVTFYDRESFKPALFNETISKLKKMRISNINLGNDSSFILSTSSHGILRYSSSFTELKNVSEGTLVGSERSQKSYLYHKGEYQYLSLLEGKSVGQIEVLEVSDSLVLFVMTDRLYEFNTKTFQTRLIHQFNNTITFLTKDVAGKVWLAIPYQGIFQYHSNTSKLVPYELEFASDKVIAGLSQSIDGGYWISTLNEGLYYFPNLDIKYVKHPNIHQHSISKVITDSTSIFVATKNSYIAKIQENEVEEISNFNCVFKDFVLDKNGELFSSTFDKRIFNHKIKKTITSNRPRKILFAEDQLYCVSSGGVYQLNKTIGEYKNLCNADKIDSWCISKKNENEILIGTVEGPWEYTISEKSFNYLGDRYPDLKAPIQNISSNGKFTIFSTNNGILLKKGEQIILLDESNGLINNICNHTFIANNSVIWVSTNGGISRISNAFDSEKRTFSNWSKEDGLSSNTIMNICEFKNTIYVATASGVNYFNKDLQPFNYSANLYIDSVEINKKTKKVNAFYELKPYENLIKVNFHAVSYKKEQDLKYKYRLSPIDSVWTETSDRFILLSSLLPGDYYLEIGVAGDDSKIKKIHFHIDLPIYQQWQFILSVCLIVLVVFYLVYRYRIKQLRSKQENENKLNDILQQSLSSQMNPHFIFNSLNSIQRFILINNKRNASKYISQFSKLMRLILDNSKHRLVNIDTEISALHLYLELEILRFKDKISYSIIIEPGMDTPNYKIPPLLLQPFVENSIWHGIMHKDGNGKILISFEEQEEQLICIIEDDGIGRGSRAKIQENNKIRHKSFGTDITSQRIELGKKLYGQSFSVQMIDLIDDNNKAIGTRVVLTIPKIK